MVDLLELGRRGKRSLDGNISYRKAGLLVFILLGRFTNHKQEIFRGVYFLVKSPRSPFVYSLNIPPLKLCIFEFHSYLVYI